MNEDNFSKANDIYDVYCSFVQRTIDKTRNFVLFVISWSFGIGLSKAFNVTVGVPTAIHYYAGGFREGLPMELLYVDDLVLIAETKELLMEMVRNWKEGMEKKGLRVNTGKTKVQVFDTPKVVTRAQEATRVAIATR